MFALKAAKEASQKHSKESSHVAVVGIVSLVAVVGLVLLFVSLAPSANVGQATRLRILTEDQYISKDSASPATEGATQAERDWSSGKGYRAAMKGFVASYARANGVADKEVAQLEKDIERYYRFLETKGGNGDKINILQLKPGTNKFNFQQGVAALQLGQCDEKGQSYQITSARFENEGSAPAGVYFFGAPITSTSDDPTKYVIGKNAKSIFQALWLPPGKWAAVSTESFGSTDYFWGAPQNIAKGVVIAGGAITGFFGGGCSGPNGGEEEKTNEPCGIKEEHDAKQGKLNRKMTTVTCNAGSCSGEQTCRSYDSDYNQIDDKCGCFAS